MSLTQALSTALAGINATQASLSIISGNVANANTTGYVRQSANQVEVTTGGNAGSGVRVTGINRELDTLLQGQLRTEMSGGSYADKTASLYQQLQQVYGTPGSSTSFDAIYNSFTTALQGLSTSPNSSTEQSAVLSAAQGMTQNLNAMTASIQQLRTQAEQGIADDVQKVNSALQQIAQINLQLGASTKQDSTTASLEDQRDQAINQIAQLMDIRVSENDHNQVTVSTSTGLQLVGDKASQLTFDNRGALSATAQWSPNSAQRGVGTITLVAPSGDATDLITNHVIQSGEIAAYLKMRDSILPQAQAQVDEVAVKMSQALSDLTTQGTPVTAGIQSGFTVDVGGVLPGNSMQVTYTDTLTNTPHTVTIVRGDDPAALPLPNTAPNPNDQVIGVNFSNGLASVVTQLNNALGSQLQFSNPVGTTLQVLNSPANSNINVNAASTTVTMTSVASGNPQLPFFLDGSTPITGTITATSSQTMGLAERINVNGALLNSPASLAVFGPGILSGDSTRPNFMLNQLTKATLTFSPSTGIGGQNAPFTGTLENFMSQIASQQSLATNAANNLQEGQDTVVNSLQQRLNSQSGVSIDTEMANLISLQNAYSANARVMTSIQKMMETLLQI